MRFTESIRLCRLRSYQYWCAAPPSTRLFLTLLSLLSQESFKIFIKASLSARPVSLETELEIIMCLVQQPQYIDFTTGRPQMCVNLLKTAVDEVYQNREIDKSFSQETCAISRFCFVVVISRFTFLLPTCC